MQDDHHSQQNVSITESDQLSSSDQDMFGNLKPVTKKPALTNHSAENAKLIMAKMKRLIGPTFNKNSLPFAPLQPTNSQQNKPKHNKKPKINKHFLEQDPNSQSQNQSASFQPRERSRDQKPASRTAESIKTLPEVKKEKEVDGGILSIQKQVVKQNDSLSSNKLSDKNNKKQEVLLQSAQKPVPQSKNLEKLQKFAEMEKLLFVPVEELPLLVKSNEEVREEKREKKRLDRMLEKKYKEYKVGKVKDQASNCVFNGIEDYFN